MKKDYFEDYADNWNESQVTYDSEAEAGYLNLVKLSWDEILDECIELDVNSDITLDFKDSKLVGLEFFGSTAEAIKHWADNNHVFKKEKKNGHTYYVFKLSEGEAQSTFRLERQNIIFLFKQDDYQKFFGIEIHDIQDYEEEYLVGHTC
ncbi:hypothetical protein ACFQ40_08495 [Kroppenstedtia eburnea]|uniref:hypothetical protein n=1 Tax=Kroppenstedtia eburnea TaxID=714067 RepID=UPI003625CE0A